MRDVSTKLWIAVKESIKEDLPKDGTELAHFGMFAAMLVFLYFALINA